MGLCMTAQIDVGVTGFTNGNSIIQDGQRYAGTAVVSNTENTYAGPHLARMSAQKAELAALKKSLELRKGIKVIKAPFLWCIATSCYVTVTSCHDPATYCDTDGLFRPLNGHFLK